MADAAFEFVRSLYPNMPAGEVAMAVDRLNTFNGFIAKTLAWRDSLPPGRQEIPKPGKITGKTFFIDSNNTEGF